MILMYPPSFHCLSEKTSGFRMDGVLQLAVGLVVREW